jgi:hypothetical protein
VAYGDKFTLTGRLMNLGASWPISGAKVKIYAVHVPSGAEALLATTTTGPRRYYTFPFDPAATYRYRAEYAGGGELMGTVSNRVDVRVAMRVEIASEARSVRVGTTFRIGTAVYPANPGAIVRLQKMSGGNWKTIATKALRKDRATIFTVPAPGRYDARYRVTTPGDGYRVAGQSKVIKVNGY